MLHGKWARWRALQVRERRATMAAAFMIPFAAAALRLVGIKRVLRFVESPGRSTAAPSAGWTSTPSAGPTVTSGDDTAGELSRAVSRASSHGPYAGNCLSRSLTLLRLLRRHGVAADLRFGARTTDGKFEAHAWVVHEGRVLNDTQDVGQRYGTLRG